MTTITDDKGRQNIFAKEPPVIMSEPTAGFTEFAERLNGRLAMVGIILALTSYFTTGTIAFGVF